jgi:hypothetical protein
MGFRGSSRQTAAFREPLDTGAPEVHPELLTAGGVLLNLVPTAYVATGRGRDTAGGAGIDDRPVRERRGTAPYGGRGTDPRRRSHVDPLRW